MVGDQLAVAEHPDPGQVRGHLDPPADRRRVDRVVVGVQPHVVIAGQPAACRHPVTGATGGSASIAARSARSGPPARSPAPGAAGCSPGPATRRAGR